MNTLSAHFTRAIARRLAAERRAAAPPSLSAALAAHPAAAARLRFADALLQEGSPGILVGDFAKILRTSGIETGQKRLFAWMRENGFLLATHTAVHNIPSQRAIELGLFAVQQRAIRKPDGTRLLVHTPRVTAKGQMYFLARLQKEAQAPAGSGRPDPKDHKENQEHHGKDNEQ